jgi:serine protease Do
MKRSNACTSARRAIACVLLTSAALAACAPRPGVGAEPPSAPQAATSSSQGNLPDFASLVEATGASVVNISITQLVRSGPEQYGIEPGDPLYEFFRRFGIPWGRLVPQQGIGSGFIVSSDGQILTNAHVVAEATEVLVRLTDKREFRAKVLGVDRKTDVALIKIDARDLPAVKIGDPANSRVGEWVAAIGSPFGFENTVTAGIISAKARRLPDEDYVPFIQTDVAVNPGNSGGPLFNMRGEVIGINSLIFSGTGGFMGLSFAIPIDVAMKVKDDLLKHGKVRRGRIGVGVQPVTAQLAESFGMRSAQGALVTMVEAGGPADRAGMKVGDVILAIGERDVMQSADLPAIVGETAPGTTISVHIWRDGAAKALRVTVGEAPSERGYAPPEGSTVANLGVVVRPLSDDEARQIQARGLLVLDVEGPAAAAGLQPGDVILAVNNQPVASVEQLRERVRAARGRLALLVQRGDVRIFVPLRID